MTTPKPAPVKWAQRNDLIYLNVELLDVEKPDIVVEKDKVIYRATDKDNQKYENTIELFDEIKPEESVWSNRGRGTEFVLIKKQSGPYWKRLLKEPTKFHWLKVDFNRWKDEDESDDETKPNDFSAMMNQMGGFGGGSPFMDDVDLGEYDGGSDDENLPDLESSSVSNGDLNPTENGKKSDEESADAGTASDAKSD